MRRWMEEATMAVPHPHQGQTDANYYYCHYIFNSIYSREFAFGAGCCLDEFTSQSSSFKRTGVLQLRSVR